MGISRKITETQLELAKSAREARIEALKKVGTEEARFGDDPKYRHFDSRVSQISRRLRKIGEIESNNEAVTKHKEERLAQQAAEKAEAKVKKVKEPKAAKKAPKAQAGAKPAGKPAASKGGKKK